MRAYEDDEVNDGGSWEERSESLEVYYCMSHVIDAYVFITYLSKIRLLIDEIDRMR